MIISRSPTRISLAGGACDFPEYFNEYDTRVISFTIDKYIYASVSPTLPLFPYKGRFTSSVIEDVREYSEISNPAIYGTLKALKFEDPIDIAITLDLPARTGLGSSSSLICALIRALDRQKGVCWRSKRSLADLAIYIERVLLNEPGGYQDQIAAAYGGFNSIEFSRKGYSVRPMPLTLEFLEEFKGRTVVSYTGQQRDSFELAKSHAENNIDVKHGIKNIADAMYDAFIDEDIDEIGKLLDLSWQYKKRISENISSTHIDALYNKAMRLGVLGAKINGNGKAGFMTLILRDGIDKDKFCQELGLVGINWDYDFEGAKIIYEE